MSKKKMTLKEFSKRYECCYSAAGVRLKKLIAKDKKFAKHVSRKGNIKVNAFDFVNAEVNYLHIRKMIIEKLFHSFIGRCSLYRLVYSFKRCHFIKQNNISQPCGLHLLGNVGDIKIVDVRA